MKLLHVVSFFLVMVGALNWGLIGLFDYNLVTMVITSAALQQMVYVLVGLAAVYLLITHQADCKMCLVNGRGRRR